MKTYFILILFLMPIKIYPQIFSLKIFPDDKFYEKYLADAISNQFSLHKHLESSQWFGNIGGGFALFNLKLYERNLKTNSLNRSN